MPYTIKIIIAHISFLIAFLLFSIKLQAQTSGVNTKTPHLSSILDLSKNTKKALLLPKVALKSTDDKTTILNPATSLLVYATEDHGAEDKIIEKDNIYKFDGNNWIRLTVKDKIMQMDLPKVEVVGTNPARIVAENGNFTLTTISDPSKLAPNGAFTAKKAGFYSFQIQLIMRFNANPNQDFNITPYLYGEGLTAFTFRFRSNGVEDTYVSATGAIYLKANETTNGFRWSTGIDNKIDGTLRYIYNQNVVWQYLGNPPEIAPLQNEI